MPRSRVQDPRRGSQSTQRLSFSGKHCALALTSPPAPRHHDGPASTPSEAYGTADRYGWIVGQCAHCSAILARLISHADLRTMTECSRHVESNWRSADPGAAWPAPKFAAAMREIVDRAMTLSFHPRAEFHAKRNRDARVVSGSGPGRLRSRLVNSERWKRRGRRQSLSVQRGPAVRAHGFTAESRAESQAPVRIHGDLWSTLHPGGLVCPAQSYQISTRCCYFPTPITLVRARMVQARLPPCLHCSTRMTRLQPLG